MGIYAERKTRFELATLSLERLMLYQLSYFRISLLAGVGEWIRTTEGINQNRFTVCPI